MKVCVFGAGYVGLVTAACLAEMGNSVVGVDIDATRVEGLNAGRVPIHEPGLDALLVRNLNARRLSFTTNTEDGVNHGTLIFIAVGTPEGEDGSADLSHVLAVARSIGDHMRDYKVIVDKSTVPVGTADAVRESIETTLRARGEAVPFSMVSNPEFLKEGAAIEDFMRPDRIVIGCETEQAELLMRALYAPFVRNRDRVISMSVRSAELTKYAANAMLATRISFMNELAGLAERVGADIEHIRVGMGSDRRIGTHFLYAGCGWGGSCFPKDLLALERMAADHASPLSIVSSAIEANRRQRKLLGARLVELFGENLDGRVIGVWGLAFKPETDDMREATSVTLIDELLERGATVQAYDPVAGPVASRIWAGRSGIKLCADQLAVCDGSDALVIVTEWREFRSPDFGELANRMRRRLILDGRNILDARLAGEAGFEYRGIGRSPVNAGTGS
jgi:UDPglucose 6-dehydrogenase